MAKRAAEAQAKSGGKTPAGTPASRRRTSQDPAADAGNVVDGIAITHPDRVLFPEAGITKLELARYYAAVAPRLLPHLEGRPLTLVRCPNGWGPRGTHCFYQKHRRPGIPDVVDPIEVPEGDGTGTYMMANSAAAIVALVQLGVIELHPWGSREGRLDRPDRIVLDFDPDDGLDWSALVDAVRIARTLLANLGLQGFLRTTGGKGLHVVVPIAPERPWVEVKGFTKAIADLLVRTFPDRFTATVSIAKRAGRTFVDYLRNAEGATAIAPYAVRAKARAPVAMPVDWSELRRDVRFDHFNLRNATDRLRRQKRDPWEGFLRLEQAIGEDALRSVGFRPH